MMDILVLVFLGLLSGISVNVFQSSVLSPASNSFLAHTDPFINFFVGTPVVWWGIFFGLALLVYFFTCNTKPVAWKAVLFVVVSAAGAFAAYLTTFFLAITGWFSASGSSGFGSSGPLSDAPLAEFIAGGFVGAFILALGIRYLLTKITMREIILIAVAGAIFAAPGAFDKALINGEGGAAPFWDYFVPLWQTGVALAIGWILQEAKRGSTAPPTTPAT